MHGSTASGSQHILDLKSIWFYEGLNMICKCSQQAKKHHSMNHSATGSELLYKRKQTHRYKKKSELIDWSRPLFSWSMMTPKWLAQRPCHRKKNIFARFTKWSLLNNHHLCVPFNCSKWIWILMFYNWTAINEAKLRNANTMIVFRQSGF